MAILSGGFMAALMQADKRGKELDWHGHSDTKVGPIYGYDSPPPKRPTPSLHVTSGTTSTAPKFDLASLSKMKDALKAIGGFDASKHMHGEFAKEHLQDFDGDGTMDAAIYSTSVKSNWRELPPKKPKVAVSDPIGLTAEIEESLKNELEWAAAEAAKGDW